MRGVFRSVALVALLATCGQMVLAKNFDKGLAAARAGDFETALQKWRPLAEQGNAYAQFNLGLMYDNGQSVPQDYAEAVKWYRLAAEQGNAVAQLKFGVKYYNGHGVIQDDLHAHMWFNISASLGEEKAANNRDLIAEKMTAADISEAQRLARECVAKDYKGC